MKFLFVIFIKIYRLFFSPLVGGGCRFSPSCSRYFEEALDKYSLGYGILLGVKRLLKCNPYHSGGVDLP